MKTKNKYVPPTKHGAMEKAYHTREYEKLRREGSKNLSERAIRDFEPWLKTPPPGVSEEFQELVRFEVGNADREARGIPARKSMKAKIENSDLQAIVDLYETGLSLKEISDKLWSALGYASSKSMQNSLHVVLRKRGYEFRTRSEALRIRFSPIKTHASLRLQIEILERWAAEARARLTNLDNGGIVNGGTRG